MNISKILNKKLVFELFRYGLAGFATVLVNISSYFILLWLGCNYIVANVISIILTKTFAYLINKFFVFRSRCANKKELIKEIILFALTRGFSGLVEFFGIIILVEILMINPKTAKLIIIPVTIIMNYIFGKTTVFNHYNK